MRRSLLVGGCGLALLLIGLGIWLVQTQATHDQTPPNATNVRVFRHGLSEVHVNYQFPASGTLSDLYQHYSAKGWARDQTTERSLQRPWADSPTTVYAVFTRQRLFGLVSEIAIIGVPADTRSGVNVRQVRCITIEPWIWMFVSGRLRRLTL
jgi:hypothetical protein